MLSFSSDEKYSSLQERINGYSIRPVYDGPDTTPTAIESINADNAQKVIKTIENGKVVIIRNGVRYDITGRRL